jgi:hypothetical protein
MSTKTTRSFVINDECPDDLYRVVDADGDEWRRVESPTTEPSRMWHSPTYGVTWTWEHLLTNFEPLTEHPRAAHGPTGEPGGRSLNAVGVGALSGWATWLVCWHGLHMPELPAWLAGALVGVVVGATYARKGSGR